MIGKCLMKYYVHQGGGVRIAKRKIGVLNDFYQKKDMICFEILVNNYFHGQ